MNIGKLLVGASLSISFTALAAPSWAGYQPSPTQRPATLQSASHSIVIAEDHDYERHEVENKFENRAARAEDKADRAEDRAEDKAAELKARHDAHEAAEDEAHERHERHEEHHAVHHDDD